MSKNKQGERNSSSSSTESAIDTKKPRTMSDSEDAANLKLLLQNLVKENRENFSKLHEEISCLRLDIKQELEEVKRITSEVEKSVQEAWFTIDDMKEDISAAKALQLEEIDKLQVELHATNTKLLETCKQLQQEKERNIELENYSRRENLKFNNIPEAQNENTSTITTKEVILDILNNEMNVDTSKMAFHAVHRIGKRRNGSRPRPIIVRFVCREDRDAVFQKKKKLQQSERFPDAYITADYAKAIQEERRALIKAMFKARGIGKSAKVVGRTLYVDNQKYTKENIPEEFHAPEADDEECEE